MLQQTQVTTVLGYYERFLQRFPDGRSRSPQAPSEDVLAMWSGLGYDARRRKMDRCAQAVVADHGGEFPRSAERLAELPGIGRRRPRRSRRSASANASRSSTATSSAC